MRNMYTCLDKLCIICLLGYILSYCFVISAILYHNMQPQIKSLSPRNQENKKLNSQQEAEKKVKEILESINLPVLVDILSELKCKAMGWSRGGLEDKKFRDYLSDFIKIKDRKNRFYLVNGIELVYKPNSVGGGEAFSNFSIKLDTPHMKNFRPVNIIQTLFHELIHIISSKDMPVKDFIYYKDGGLGYFVNKKRPSNRPLNEGFTELMTGAIVSEYILRAGEKRIDTKEYESSESYAVYRILSEKIIDIIAEESEVPRDVVVRSMLGHYMRADWTEHMDEINKLASDELKKLFKFSRKNITEEEMWKELNSMYKYETGTFREKIKNFGLHIRRKFKQYKYMRPHTEAIFGRDAIGYLD